MTRTQKQRLRDQVQNQVEAPIERPKIPFSVFRKRLEQAAAQRQIEENDQS
jgi:hypothetical protein